MKLEDASSLTENQLRRIQRLQRLAPGRKLRVELSSDEKKIHFFNAETGKRICSSPVTDFLN